MTVQKQHIPTDYMPILSMMVKPRDAFHYALQRKQFSYAIYIGILGAFASNLTLLYGTAYPMGYSLGQIVYSSFVTGIIYFMLMNLIMAMMLNVVGGFFGGKGTFKPLFQMMCLTMIPYIWVLPILLFWLQLAPQTYFSMPYDATLGQLIGSYFGGFAILAASIWTFIVSLVGISEVHGFSKWKAFFTLLLAGVIVGLIVTVFSILLV